MSEAQALQPFDAVVADSARDRTGVRRLLRALLHSTKGMTGAVLVGLAILAAVTAPIIAPHSPTKTSVRAKFAEPIFIDRSSEFPLGGDNLGRDTFSRILYGARASLAIGFLVMLVAAVVGSVLGAVAGFRGDSSIRSSCGRLTFNSPYRSSYWR